MRKEIAEFETDLAEVEADLEGYLKELAKITTAFKRCSAILILTICSIRSILTKAFSVRRFVDWLP